jgi:hypothetical protein
VVWGLHTGAGINVVCARQCKMKFQRIVPSEHFVAEDVVTENVPALLEQVGVDPKNRRSKPSPEVPLSAFPSSGSCANHEIGQSDILAADHPEAAASMFNPRARAEKMAGRGEYFPAHR